MLYLYFWPPRFFGEMECKPTMHGFATRGAVAKSKARQIKGQIKADNRCPKFIADAK